MIRYYKVDGQTLTYAEYWRLSPDPVSFCLAALRKFLHFPIRFNFSIPRMEELVYLYEDELPPRVLRKWQPALEVCEDERLHVHFFFHTPLLERKREGYAAVLLSEDRLVQSLLCYARTPPVEVTAFSCLSRFSDGHDLVTTDQPKRLEPDPRYELVWLPGYRAEVILSQHLEEISQPGRTPVRVSDVELRRYVLEREQRHVDFHIARGVYIPMTDEEIDWLSCCD